MNICCKILMQVCDWPREILSSTRKEKFGINKSYIDRYRLDVPGLMGSTFYKYVQRNSHSDGMHIGPRYKNINICHKKCTPILSNSICTHLAKQLRVHSQYPSIWRILPQWVNVLGKHPELTS